MLTFESTHGYKMRNPSIYYCDSHDCLRVSDNFEDSVMFEGVEKKDINSFISNYIEYVYEDTELAETFKQATKEKAKTSSYEVS